MGTAVFKFKRCGLHEHDLVNLKKSASSAPCACGPSGNGTNGSPCTCSSTSVWVLDISLGYAGICNARWRGTAPGRGHRLLAVRFATVKMS